MEKLNMKHKESIDLFNNAFRKRLYMMLTVLLVIFVGVGTVLVIYYNNHFKNLLDDEARWKLEHISSSNVQAVQKEIESKRYILKCTALAITRKNESDKVKILERLKEVSEDQGFYDMGIIDRSGIGYTVSGETLDLSTYDYYQKGMEGISQITMSYKSEEDSVRLNLFTYPIYKGKDVDKILMAMYKSEDLYKILNTVSFGGVGKSVLINKEGILVTLKKSNGDIQVEECDLLEDIKRDNIKMYNKMLEDMAGAKKDSIRYNFQGTEYLAYYEPILIQDWYLVSIVPSHFIYQNINDLINSINLIIMLGVLIFIMFTSVFILNYIKYQKRVAHIVFIDDLTQEKNLEYLKMDFANMSFEERQKRSLVVLDIHKFKTINMIYGSHVGDELLKLIPQIFKKQLPEDTIYKDRADLFIAVIEHENREQLISKIYPLIQSMKKEVEAKWGIPLSISMGICKMKYSSDLNEIYNNALIAENNVKGKLDQVYSFFDADSKNKIIRNTEIETKFIAALENEEFEVWYQPKYDMRDGKIKGAEALIRWRDGKDTLLAPGEFIPIFEHNGQIIQLDKEVIRQVCRDIAEIRSLGIQSVPVSINLSRLHLEHFGIVKTIEETIKKYEINPAQLSFEITESALIHNADALDYIVCQLHKLGVTVEMDDYGVGTSTISSLLSSKFDVLKLDKSFIDQIGETSNDIVIQSTICMARKLNMEVVAEGIECEKQVSFLVANGCYLGQGFYFSKPLEKKYYMALLTEKL